jgi:hypothetical protein
MAVSGMYTSTTLDVLVAFSSWKMVLPKAPHPHAQKYQGRLVHDTDSNPTTSARSRGWTGSGGTPTHAKQTRTSCQGTFRRTLYRCQEPEGGTNEPGWGWRGRQGKDVPRQTGTLPTPLHTHCGTRLSPFLARTGTAAHTSRNAWRRMRMRVRVRRRGGAERVEGVREAAARGLVQLQGTTNAPPCTDWANTRAGTPCRWRCWYQKCGSQCAQSHPSAAALVSGGVGQTTARGVTEQLHGRRRRR